MTRRSIAAWTLTGLVATSTTCGGKGPDPMNALAERYVRLVLAVGQHDRDYVDAYYGPSEWRTEAEAAKFPLAEIARRADALASDVAVRAPGTGATDSFACVISTWPASSSRSAPACRCSTGSGCRSTTSRGRFTTRRLHATRPRSSRARSPSSRLRSPAVARCSIATMPSDPGS